MSKLVVANNPTQATLNRAIEADISLITERQFCSFFDVPTLRSVPNQSNKHRGQSRIQDDFRQLTECVVIDVETTGLSPHRDHVVSVTALKVNLNVPIKEQRRAEMVHTMIKPPIPIPAEATRINGITDRMVRDEPNFESNARAIRDFIGLYPIVGHNVSFDLGFLNAEFRSANVDTLQRNEAYCTMRAYQKSYPGKASLDAVLKRFGLGRRTGKFHDSREDARLTALVAARLAAGDSP